jgi:CDP-diacylglycerol--serine O-phosphatidyltransferase
VTGLDDEPPIDPGPAWLGPKASEDDVPVARRFGGGLTLRAVLPNAITAAALCSGLTGVGVGV